MCEKSREQVLQEELLAEEVSETKKMHAFAEKERAMFEKEWEQNTRDREQEITRRGIEACLSVLRTADPKTAFGLGSDEPTEAKNIRLKAWNKIDDLLGKLG